MAATPDTDPQAGSSGLDAVQAQQRQAAREASGMTEDEASSTTADPGYRRLDEAHVPGGAYLRDDGETYQNANGETLADPEKGEVQKPKG